MSARIDENLLPKTAAIDTGVFLRGVLGDRADEPQSASCAAFCSAMIAMNRTLFIAAPTLTEVIRYQGKTPPHVPGIIVVPFDARAATILGQDMPIPELKTMANETGVKLTYLKYDGLIVACAKRASAAVLVALDTDHTKIARRIGFPVARPDDYLSAQEDLFEERV